MRRATLFGKLPAHGDFVTRGIAAAERDSLDHWLAGSLAEARSELGEAFESTYDLAPPWRFAAERADGWHVGAMAPSVDGVGRRYPIVVGIDGLAAGEVATAAETVEGLIYEALGGGWDADRLFAAATASDPAAGDGWTYGDRWWTLGGGTGTDWAFLEDSVAGARPPRLMRAVLMLSEIGNGMGQEAMA